MLLTVQNGEYRESIPRQFNQHIYDLCGEIVSELLFFLDQNKIRINALEKKYLILSFFVFAFIHSFLSFNNLAKWI